ncbi:hypothetical protein ABH935_009936 [Catenulispora sp. GAS73]
MTPAADPTDVWIALAGPACETTTIPLRPCQPSDVPPPRFAADPGCAGGRDVQLAGSNRASAMNEGGNDVLEHNSVGNPAVVAARAVRGEPRLFGQQRRELDPQGFSRDDGTTGTDPAAVTGVENSEITGIRACLSIPSTTSSANSATHIYWRSP